MLETILIALDCSKTSETVLNALEDLNLSKTTRLILTHVVTLDNDKEIVDQPGQSLESRYSYIEQKLLQYQSQFPDSVIEMTQGDPADEIIRLANIYQVNLIIIGTRGLRGINRIIGDSVSSSVLENAPCSVLVVKQSIRYPKISNQDIARKIGDYEGGQKIEDKNELN